MIGMILGDRYELLEKIGEGGMSEVYKARCYKLNRYDAVKILKRELANDEELVEKFKREATAVANLSDNNIVNIFDVGSQDNIHYIVMEYVKGKTLKGIIHENVRLNYEKALDYGTQIARALDCAHRNNIIHRDIKPQNILVTEDGIVKVTDFGIAKSPTSVTIINTNKVMGSAHYFSPEQAKGNVVDVRTDVYSLGIVLYEMVTGRVPYDADSPVSVALKHIQEQVVPPRQLNSAIPESLNKLILRAIEKDPNMRYQSIKELLIDMIRIQKDVNAEIITINVEDEFTRVMDAVNIDREPSKGNDKKKKGPNSKTKGALIFSLIAILVVALGALAGWAASRNKTPGGAISKTVTVPDVVGLKQDEAKAKIEAAGLIFEVLDVVSSDVVPQGNVIETKPGASSEVKANSPVQVRISAGFETYKIPDLRDFNSTTAKDLLIKSGFKAENISITPEYSDTVPADMILRQSPDAGGNGDKNTKIQLFVSKGPQFRSVPDLTGKTIAEAENILKNIKLVLGNKTPIETNDSSMDGKIISQSVEKDTQVKEGQTISVSYGKYVAKKIILPDFKDKTGREYKSDLLNLSSKLKITFKGREEDKVKSIAIGDKTLKPSESVEEGSTIIITTEAAQPATPSTGVPTEDPATPTAGNQPN